MSYCLNPNCTSPRNIPNAAFCQSCGAELVLRDRYRASRVLGRGGFGTTFLAQDEGLPGQPSCVIKQMRPPSDNPNIIESARKLFQREANTLGKLGSNPQITRLIDFFESGDDFYLVQEYIEGLTLERELKQSGPFSEAKMKAVLKDILPVLAYLHGQKVIHRDIKPANIIRRSFDQRLVLIDFGVVKDQMGQTQFLDAQKQGALTQFSLGTIGFAPPEQLSKRPVYASDIYSLGATCFFLLAAQLPSELEYDSQTGEVIFPSQLNISPRFQDLLKKMLAESVRDRYKSAQDVLEALEQLDKSETESQTQAVAQAVPQGSFSPASSSASSLSSRGASSAPSSATATLERQALAREHQAPIAQGNAIAPPKPLDAPVNYVPSPASAPQRKPIWWNRPLIGDRSLTQRIVSIFIKRSISERAIQLHQQSLISVTTLSEKALAVDSEKFGNQEFLAFVRIQYALGKGNEEYKHLTRSAELLRVGIKAKNAFLKIEQIELAYRGSKQNEFYTFIQELLTQKLEKETFIAQAKTRLAELIPEIKSQEGKASLQTYVDQLEIIAAHEFGLKLLSLFKKYQLSDYSILRAVSEMVNRLHNNELFDMKGLIAEVAARYDIFEKLGNIIGIPVHKREPETYAKLLQYLALSEKYQLAYGKFQQLVALLEQWIQHKNIITTIRQEYRPREYKLPKEFKLDIPGQDIYDKYESYFAASA